MERSVPLWFFALCLLLGALFIVAFGWAIKSTLAGNDASGLFGRAAVQVASFPTTTRQVLAEVFGYASGDYKDEAIRVQRETEANYSGFQHVSAAIDIKVPGLLMRPVPNRITPGWRAVIGAFQINGDIENAVLLLSPELKIVKHWILDEVSVNGRKPRPKYRKFVHGVEILRDGSLIFTFDGGISLQRFDACGQRRWMTLGEFHHAVTLDEDAETVWTFSDARTVAQVNTDDGAILRRIAMDEIIASNPMIDILEIRRQHSNDLGLNSRDTAGGWLSDPYHLNDVEPLPAGISNRFSRFDAGDLLISARSLNLIFVLDPQTLEVKWWRIGAVQRQHDPDWLDSGDILVLNNRMSRDFSEIVAINTDTFSRTVVLDGRKYGFYTRIRGKQQLLEDGGLVITSPQQGRAFEVDDDGEVVFEIVNLKPGSSDTNYVISELKWLPIDYLDPETWQCRITN